MLGTQTWRGPYGAEAASAYERARHAGLSELRARIVGHIASYRETWAFASSIAGWVHASRRTVFRALAQAKETGLIGSRPIKDDEIPPGANGPITCGGSLRWTIGWGKAMGDARAAVAAARVRWLLRTQGVGGRPATTDKPKRKPPEQPPHTTQRPSRPEYQRRMTAEEIDAALASDGGEAPPD